MSDLATQVLTVLTERIMVALSTTSTSPVAGSTVLAKAQPGSGCAVSFTPTGGSFPNGNTASSFTSQSGGETVGTANLSVMPYALTVSDGKVALTCGSPQYDFRNAQAHTFTVVESNYPGSFTMTGGNPAVAAVSISGGALTVTPGTTTTAGFSTVTVQDGTAFGQTFTFTVSVTTAVFN